MILLANLTYHPCHICGNDKKLKKKIEAIMLAAMMAKRIWQDHPTTQECIDSHLAGEDGEVTLIPTYESYNQMLVKAWLTNPLENDWRTYDRHNAFHKNYLDSTMETINEQLLLWSTDEKHVIVIAMRNLLNKLRDLQQYIYW